MKPEIALAALLAIVLFSTGDAFAAAWGKTGNRWWFVAMLVAGNLAWILFAILNKSLPLAVVGAVVNLGLVLLSTLIGYVVFKEQLLALEKVAMVIGLIALVLFAYARSTAPSADAIIQTSKNVPETPECLNTMPTTSPTSAPETTCESTTATRSMTMNPSSFLN